MKTITRHAGEKVICLVILMAFTLVLPVQGKETGKPDMPNGPSSTKMPESSGNAAIAQGYEAAKKAIAESEKEQKGPTLKEAVQTIVAALSQEKAEPQKGDP